MSKQIPQLYSSKYFGTPAGTLSFHKLSGKRYYTGELVYLFLIIFYLATVLDWLD